MLRCWWQRALVVVTDLILLEGFIIRRANSVLLIQKDNTNNKIIYYEHKAVKPNKASKRQTKTNKPHNLYVRLKVSKCLKIWDAWHCSNDYKRYKSINKIEKSLLKLRKPDEEMKKVFTSIMMRDRPI